MISLLRRNRKKNEKKESRPKTTSNSEDSKSDVPTDMKLYNESSLDSLIFAASLGLVSTHQQSQDSILVVQDQLRKRQLSQQQQQMEYHCPFCGKGYRWKSTMKRHELLECGNKPPSFQCPQCPYKARQRGNLTVHLKRHHQRD